jgi:hypothetical protein
MDALAAVFHSSSTHPISENRAVAAFRTEPITHTAWAKTLWLSVPKPASERPKTVSFWGLDYGLTKPVPGPVRDRGQVAPLDLAQLPLALLEQQFVDSSGTLGRPSPSTVGLLPPATGQL